MEKDFRLFLQEELISRCKRNPKYSLRAFAQTLGIENSALSKILAGKRGVSASMLETLAKRLGLGPEELAQFVRPEERRGKKTEAPQDSLGPDYKQLTLDQFVIISEWYHYAILELLKVKGFKSSPKWMARSLGISVPEVNAAIERLLRLEYLSRDKNGDLISSGESHTTVGNEFTAQAFRRLQAQVLEMAKIALEEVPIEERDQSSMTMAVNSKKVKKAKERIRNFRRELCEYLQSGGDLDEVYQLGVSLYPLTRIKNNG